MTDTKPLCDRDRRLRRHRLELAKQFAEHDFDVLISAEDAGPEAAAADLRAMGADVQVVQSDLSSYDGVEQLYSAISQAGRPVSAAKASRPGWVAATRSLPVR